MSRDTHFDDTDYLALFEAIPIGLYRSSAEGDLLQVNRAFIEMLGYAGSAELKAQPARTLYADPADRDRWQEMMDREGVVRDSEVRLRRKDGSVLRARESSFATRDDTGRVVSYQGALEDITREVERAEELRRSEERFRAFTEHAADVISLLAADGTVLYESPAIERVLGFTQAERVGEIGFSYVHPEDMLHVDPEFRWLLENPGATTRVEARMRHKDGTWRTISATGTNLLHDPAVEGVVVNYRDVSERNAAESEVRRQRAFYEEILGKIEVDIAVFDVDLRFQYVNQSSIADPELREWLIGRTDLDYCRRINRPLETAHKRMQWMRVAIEEARSTEVEEELTTKAGETVHIIRRWSPVLDDEGRVTRLIGYGFDVTARRKAEQALRAREEELRQAMQLDAIGKLAGGVAHDFNNLLTAIQGNAQLLMEKMPGLPMRAELEDIALAAQRAAALTRQLLAFGRKQVLQPTILDLNDVVGEMSPVLQMLLGDAIELRLELADGLWTVSADRSRIEEAITNLALNARDAMPGAGTLTVITSNRAPAEDTRTRGKGIPGDVVTLTVSDTGRGMDRETVDRIFEPFFTTKETASGAGLGMSTVYGIVEQSGGEVQVQSAVGRGTQVEIRLPRALEEGTAAPQKTVSGARRSGAGTVLVVEDEAAVRNLVRRVLERAGYQVLIAGDADAAIAAMREHTAEIDLLLSDVVMPGMDGPELRERLLEYRSDLPTIFMSGYSDVAITHQGSMGTDTGFMEKPFTADDLIRRVREFLAVDS